jgi:hypothetical protein
MIDDDDDFSANVGTLGDAPAAASSGSGSRRGGGAVAKKAAKGSKLPCLVQSCSGVRVVGKRFCDTHKRSEDAMKYQAAAQQKIDGEALNLMNKLLSDDILAGIEVEKFGKQNPPDKKYLRKQLVQWASYLKISYKNVFAKEENTETPMTQAAFNKYCELTLGLTDVETKDWWKDLYSNPKTERDTEGFKGRVQLWIPTGKMRTTGSETGVNDQVHQGGNQIKSADERDVNVLKKHVLNQDADLSSQWFRSAAATSSSSTPLAGDQGTLDEENAPKKKRQILKPERDAPKYHQQMQIFLTSFTKTIDKAQTASQSAVQLLIDIPEEKKQKDKALNSYTSTLQFQMQVFNKFCGHTEVVKLFNNYVAPVADSAVPSTPLSSTQTFYPDNRASVMTPSTPRDPATPSTAAPSTPATSPPPEASPKRAVPASCHVKPGSVCFTEEYIVEVAFRKLMHDFVTKKPFPQEIDKAMTLHEMQDHCAQITDIDEPDMLADHIEDWEEAVKIALAVVKAVIHSSDTLAKHLLALDRAKVKQAKQDAVDKTATQLKTIREQAKLQAEAIKVKHQAAHAAATPKVFTLDIAIPGIAEIALHTAKVEQAQQATLYSEPCVLRDMPEVALWLSDHVVQKSLTSFASGYRKKAETTAGRTQVPVDVKQGKAATAAMFDAFVPTQDVLDIARDQTISGGQAFMDGLWMFGFSPDMKYSGFTPNNSACLRALALGEVKILLVDVQSLVKVTKEKALTPGCKDQCKNLSYLEELNNWDDAKLKSLVASGVKMKRFVQKQGDLLYIPQGFLIVESTMPGQSLVYGVRKSMMMKGGEHASAYRATTELFRASQRNCERMDAIFQMMKD